MSTRYQRRAKRRLRDLRRKLEEIFEQGGGLAASAETPGQPTIDQTVYVRRAPDGTAAVHVEHYYPDEWDHTVDETEHYFATFAEALE